MTKLLSMFNTAGMCAVVHKSALYAMCLRLDWQIQLSLCGSTAGMSVRLALLTDGYATDRSCVTSQS